MVPIIDGLGAWHWMLKSSGQAAVLVVLIAAVQWLLRNRLAPKWRYALWWLVVVRLLVPVSPESLVSIFNWASALCLPDKARASTRASHASVSISISIDCFITASSNDDTGIATKRNTRFAASGSEQMAACRSCRCVAGSFHASSPGILFNTYSAFA